MAPELRTRKAKAEPTKVVAAKDAPSKKAKAAAPSSKRKATEDASPVSKKKSKADVASKPRKSKAEKEEPKLLEPVDNESESEEEAEDDQAQALAKQIDSDDEDVTVDDTVAFKEGQDVGKAPKPSAAVVKAAKSNGKEESGVVYVGRIPHGFYEHEMRAYFSQFGPILRIRLSRNRKTGQSKHFAFIEFAENSTAEIACRTMNGYLMFGHILKCEVVPSSQVHENLWKGSNRRFKKVPWNKIAGKKLEKPLSESNWAKKISREEKRREERAKKLAAMGYDFDGPKMKSLEDVPKKPEAIEAGDGEESKAIEAPISAEDAAETAAEETTKSISKAKENGAKPAKKVKAAAGDKKAKTPKTKKAKS